jgi:hypothetical protein
VAIVQWRNTSEESTICGPPPIIRHFILTERQDWECFILIPVPKVFFQILLLVDRCIVPLMKNSFLGAEETSQLELH